MEDLERLVSSLLDGGCGVNLGTEVVVRLTCSADFPGIVFLIR